MDDLTPVPPEYPPAEDAPGAASAPGPVGAPSPEVPVAPPPAPAQAAYAPPEPAMYAPPPAPIPAAPTEAPRSSGLGVTVAVSLLIALLVGTMAGAAAGFMGARLTGGRISLTPAKVTVVPSKTSEPVTAAAAAAVPSVVNLDVTVGTTSSSQDPALPGDHPNVPMSGNGSGVAYKQSADGGTYIITNNHVVENAKTIVVRDAAGNRHDAELIGRDAETDIAVVKVKDKIPAIALGDSDKALVGQLVVAIGSPYGREHSVTSGVISAIGRSLPDFGADTSGTYPLVDVIQTDAAINPGNSGGALVDREGLLLGINTAIYSDSGSSGGIGFAIPVNTATRVAGELIKGGSVEHPFLGVIGQTVDETLAKEENLTVNEGAFIVDLTPGTNAVKAGIKAGDVIIGLNDTKIRSMDDLLLAVRRHAVGDTVTVKLVRDGKEVTLRMQVGVKPANLDTSTPTTGTP
jgi:S1-C subfamily serine protease